MTPVVVYVAGYGRSGSTLLDAVLGSGSGALGAGEVGRSLALLGDPATRCSCDHAVGSCPVWSAVAGDLSAAGISIDDAVAVTQRGESRSPGRNRKPYADLWRLVFDSLARSAGASFVIDSTKTARDASRRPIALVGAGLDVRIVHLVRNPSAVVTSRASSPGHVHDAAEARTVGGVRSIVGWLMANTAAERAVARVGRSARMRYEDLVTDPIAAIARLEEALSIDLGPAAALVAAGGRLSAGHALFGNRMRWQGGLRLERRDASTALTGGISHLVLPVARKYGYT